jgi:hypothetical protein
VARRAFMAGELDGKRRANMRAVMEAVCGLVAALFAFNFCTTGHFYERREISKIWEKDSSQERTSNSCAI